MGTNALRTELWGRGIALRRFLRRDISMVILVPCGIASVRKTSAPVALTV